MTATRVLVVRITDAAFKAWRTFCAGRSDREAFTDVTARIEANRNTYLDYIDSEKQVARIQALAGITGPHASMPLLDPDDAFEPVLSAARALEARGFFAESPCADLETARDMAAMRQALDSLVIG